ncbi:hypothetical protein OS493_012817 [Desmophyllum pertusum]|uniref:Uncharacterized protein n=1 Tax=Desmophyllum pertusum TaxID=174260 RepID=A0A9X0CTU9_9CNID|nr:hypothetical protein OS493_012817 [Desmophyllum pertusum]
MAADEGLFMFGDDLETILELLESDEAMEEQFVSAVSEVQSVELVCHCGKKYKTKGGLERHRAAKHSQNSQAPQLLTQSVLMEIVSTAIQKIKESKVFSEGIRSELSLYQYEVLEEGSEEFKNLKSLFEGHMKNSHVEKFYGKYLWNSAFELCQIF